MQYNKIARLFAVAFALILMLTLTPAIGIRAGEDERAEAVRWFRAGLENYDEIIDLSGYSVKREELVGVFSDAIKDSPYLFFVANNLSYTYGSDGFVITVRPSYKMERQKAEEAVRFCRREIEGIADLIGRERGELEKLVAAHDYICSRYSYDTALESNNIYTFFENRRGTCQGYSWAYMALLRELGIECSYVASDSIIHIWLLVKIEGEWYHSDVTWDDPPHCEESGGYNRAHLLFSDERADREGYAGRYGALNVKCESTVFDGNDLLSSIPFCLLSGDLDHDGEITLRDLLLLRLYPDNGKESSSGICLVCADADGNMTVDGDDAEYIRRILLER